MLEYAFTTKLPISSKKKKKKDEGCVGPMQEQSRLSCSPSLLPRLKMIKREWLGSAVCDVLIQFFFSLSHILIQSLFRILSWLLSEWEGIKDTEELQGEAGQIKVVFLLVFQEY